MFDDMNELPEERWPYMSQRTKVGSAPANSTTYAAKIAEDLKVNRPTTCLQNRQEIIESERRRRQKKGDKELEWKQKKMKEEKRAQAIRKKKEEALRDGKSLLRMSKNDEFKSTLKDRVKSLPDNKDKEEERRARVEAGRRGKLNTR